MFGGPPPPPSKAELQAQEKAACTTVRNVCITSVVLYLSPFAIDFARKLF
ncbi:hypothetical protein L228DRAFT_284586 [Xylona heveae TC161]|uniref:Mitochondrial outer membrane translocase complex, subunit Tom5 n=1 Tax=Xylona heveae (strain CBS 132557 / TC161) TaxID=1328760 RepID=A0A165AKE9_XYLHT|nr:hypothetical protein L228DRAFT_284586 [Xylona heveae TC161]KZF20630.1 hypothetical protein L228DRAFT_284586 [Xylona heveae TC161]